MTKKEFLKLLDEKFDEIKKMIEEHFKKKS